MKLNPTTQPTGKPTVSRMWVVSIKNEDRVFSDAGIAEEYRKHNKHKFATIREVRCEERKV